MLKRNTINSGIATFLLIFSSLLIFNPLSAQNGEIKGTVFDKAKGTPLAYAAVSLKGTDIGALTDNSGFYSLNKIPPGDYTLHCTTLGYDTFDLAVKIVAGAKKRENIYINQRDKEVAVEITKNRAKDEIRVGASVVELTPSTIKIIPSVGGEPDLAQYLQVIPGITFTGDQGGQLYVRGGSPIQNLVLLDGMTIYNPFHSIGLFSVFDVDIIKNVEVYTGGFNAQYGGRISGVMDVTTKDGDMTNFHGKLGVSPFTSKIQLEGPISKFVEGQGGSSFLFSLRNSYLKESAPLFYSYANSNGLPYDFNDIYGKITLSAGNGANISFFGFDFTDDVNFKGLTEYKWEQYGFGTKFHIVPPGSSSTIIDGHFSYSNYFTRQKDVDVKERHSGIGGFQAGLDFTNYLNKDMIKYGFAVEGYSTDFSYYNAANALVSQQNYSTQVSAYFRYNKVLQKLRLVLDPSFRMQYYANSNEMSPEPRFGLKYNATKFLRFKSAGGLYSQNFMAAQSDRDVVNLFYGILTSPENLPSTFNGNSVTTNLQKGRDIIGGFELDFTKKMGIQVEGYFKQFTQLTNINRNKEFDNTKDFANQPDYLKQDFIIESGKATGIDFTYTFDSRPYYLYVTYSLAKVTRFDGTATYFPNWDRRNTINVVSSYQFGKHRSWELTARWTYGSGFPFSLTQGYYELLDFQKGGLGTDYTKANGSLNILYSGYNNGRLSDFHRFDISLRKSYKFGPTELKVVASVTNVYNRENVFYFDRVNNVRINQLPILPSLALNFSF